jgi:hypothetical protein
MTMRQWQNLDWRKVAQGAAPSTAVALRKKGRRLKCAIPFSPLGDAGAPGP